GAADAPDPSPQLRVLVLGGSSGSHQTRPMIELFEPAAKAAAVELNYSEDPDAALVAESLARYDALLIFKDDGVLTAETEQALVRFVESGRGLVAVHCASHAFRGSHAYTQLIGGRFLRHGHESFRPTMIDAQHPAVAGVASFATRDETYVHNELADDNRVLMVRREAGAYEPYTWVRAAGRGRVYYTALGHDAETWRQPAFHRQLIQALRWTAAAKAEPGPGNGAEGAPPSVADYTRRALEEAPPPPLAPAESMQRMHLPEGFRVKLFAAEPQIVKPLSMAFDARGRAWIIESVDYPNEILPPFEGHDRIKICADTDGDGRADRFTVFAEGLNIPTSLLPYRDGVLVALAPHIVFLRDTDGDDVCDRREILFSGFGRFDTHAVHSNLRWGCDNWVWGTVGYSGGELDVAGKHLRFKQGVFRFKPDDSDFEFLTSTSNNTWGLGFRETGEVFVSTANNQHAVHLAIPNRYYERVRGWHGQGSSGIEDHKRFHPVGTDVRQVDWHGEYTAAAGQTVYTARSFPPEYADRATLVCEPTGHLVHIDWLVGQGSGYVARDGWNLLASDDPWCAPIETHVGPDGAVWLIDWYNYIVRHNPTPPGFETGRGNAYVTPQRDKQHGRIYRIVHGDAEQSAAPARQTSVRLFDAPSVGLIAALDDDNLWVRLTAQRLLYERTSDETRSALVAGLLDPAAGERALAHLLWSLAGSDELQTHAAVGARLAQLLQHPSVAVRRAALGALPRTAEAGDVLLASGTLGDAEPSVRLAALLTLADMPGSTSAARHVAEALRDPAVAGDRWLPQAAIAAAAPSSLDFLRQLAQVAPLDPNRALTDAARVLGEHWARGAAHDGLEELIADLAAGEPQHALAALQGLAAGWPAESPVALRRSAQPALERLCERLPPEGQLLLVDLAQKWRAGDSLAAQLKRIEQALVAQLEDETQDVPARVRAAQQLANLAGRGEVLQKLVACLTPQASPALSQGILDALAETKSADTAALVTAAWPRMTPAVRRQAVALLLRRPAWTGQLLTALDERQIPRDDLALDHTQQLVRHPDQALAARAREILDAGPSSTSGRAEVLQRFLPLANRPGDPQLGRKVFEQNCAKCHRHGSLGEAIGPDLTGIAARRREEILADVLDPNRSVEGNYRQYTLSTTGGEIFTGLLLAETQAGYELLDSQAKKHFVLRGDVDEFQASTLSVMPEGFEKLAAEELTGLIEFLAARGKYLPLSLAKSATIVSTLGMFNDRASSVERLVLPEWGPKVVSGVPFQLIDPRGDQVPNVILLEGPPGAVSRTMPRQVRVACGLAARRIHLLSGVSGWGSPIGAKGSVSMVLRLHYTGGATEDHELQNGVHFADYIRRVDVPGSEFAFPLRDQQMRYLAVTPRSTTEIEALEFIKGPDQSAPVVMAVTIERPEE
ncbi:MAG: ThuA domain-containing protein, partial [Planctomycetaceae bacterium]|nr:ThuA domain-containing protein [Planctomycetaceae bacterium]